MLGKSRITCQPSGGVISNFVSFKNNGSPLETNRAFFSSVFESFWPLAILGCMKALAAKESSHGTVNDDMRRNIIFSINNRNLSQQGTGAAGSTARLLLISINFHKINIKFDRISIKMVGFAMNS